VGVAAQHLPILVAGDERHLVEAEAGFEQAARALVAEVVEMQALDAQIAAGAGDVEV
jgi:hypothetical protein